MQKADIELQKFIAKWINNSFNSGTYMEIPQHMDKINNKGL